MNDSELTIVELPNGAKAYLKPFFTRKDYNLLMQTMSQDLQLDAKTSELSAVPLSVSLQVQSKALEILLIKIVLTDGTAAPNPVEAVDNMKNEDVTELFDKIDELTQNVFASKKN